MDDLIAGYKRFRERGWPERRKIFEELSEKGQSPTAMVIGCIDSRVDPAMIFDVAPGEIMIVRNVANLVPPYEPDTAYHGTSAALEFGVRVMGITDIIVLGHGMCGGVQALLKGAPANARDFVAPWMSMASSARERSMHLPTEEERQSCCEQEVIKVSIANIMTFPWVAERVATGALNVHGAWFAIHSGILMILQPDGRFVDAETYISRFSANF
ncbi:MAG: carbonic anhydrase family protein [Micavibrio sp.]|nr:carbonic anhydrase family protein [Micavibrio sp.]